MRPSRLLPWCATCAILSCSDGGFEVAPTIFGEYTLLAVNGQELPIQIETDYVLLRITCVLRADSTVASRVDATDGGAAVRLTATGSFEITGDVATGATITFVGLDDLELPMASATIWLDSLAFTTAAGDRYSMRRIGEQGRGVWTVDPDPRERIR